MTKLTEGTHPVLFAVHASGGILSFARLARHLHTEQPCYVLKGKGIDSDRGAFRDLYELAGSYAEEILRIQPQGPYMILGRQSETVIEVGQQLMQRGKTPSLTIVFDAGPPKHRLRGRTPGKLHRLLFRARRNLLFAISLFFDWVRVIANLASPSRSAGNLSLRERVRIQRFAQKRSTEVPKFINQDLVSSYAPRHYRAKVVFIQSVDHKRKCPNYIEMWRATSDEVVYHTTPGAHATMYDPPHVYVLAGLVQKLCDRAADELPASGRPASTALPQPS